jgi:hypothetical protein
MKTIAFLLALIISNAHATYSPMGMRLAGVSYFPGTASCTWTRTSSTVASMGAVAACPGPTVEFSYIGTWATTDSDLPRQTITSLPAGVYRATFFAMQNMSVGGSTATLTIGDGTTSCEPIAGNDATGTSEVVVSCVFSYSSSGTRSFELFGGSDANAIRFVNSSTTPRRSVKFMLEYQSL